MSKTATETVEEAHETAKNAKEKLLREHLNKIHWIDFSHYEKDKIYAAMKKVTEIGDIADEEGLGNLGCAANERIAEFLTCTLNTSMATQMEYVECVLLHIHGFSTEQVKALHLTAPDWSPT